jgi:PPOX class probable F420-dependent enzyme
MPRMAPDLLARFLEQPFVGVIATLRRDGRPYTVPVWWLYDDGAFWITGTYSRVWCRQLFNDPRASLCIEAGAPMPGHVGVDGVVTPHELPDFDIWPVSRRLAEKYVGRGDPANAEAVDRFFANMQTEPRLLFRLEPEVRRAIDMSVYRGKRADRDYQERGRTSGEERDHEVVREGRSTE